MIPKIIHYCWFGNAPLPPLALKCIESWKKYFPDYEIKLWNETNFDVNSIPYTQQAYQARKYAFVSDYARFWILYHFGGLYFDTDVEVVKPMDDIVGRGAYMGFETTIIKTGAGNVMFSLGVNPGLGLGVNSGLGLYKELLNLYASLQFIRTDGSLCLTTVVDYTTRVLMKHGLIIENKIQEVAGCWIYPTEFFCPINYWTKECIITKNTRSIHHYSESWKSKWTLFKELIQKMIGENNVCRIVRLKSLIFRK